MAYRESAAQMSAGVSRDPVMSLTAYAKSRKLAPMSVSRAVKKGRLPGSAVIDEQTGKCIGISDPELADRELAQNSDYTRAPHEAARHGEAPPSGEDSPMSLMEASARQKLAQAKLAEVKLAQIEGELIPAADVRNQLEQVFRTCRTKLLGVPSRAVEALGLTPAQAGRLEELVREALEELAQGGIS
jgi:phage terminase Nu1 subunit (DNA packaging protein)